MTRPPAPLLLLAALSLTASCVSDTSPDTDDLRSVTSFRQWHREPRLDARITLSNGSLHILPGRHDELYRVTSEYTGTSVPVAVYFPERGSLSLTKREGGNESSADTTENYSIRFGGHHKASPTTTLALSPAPDVALQLDLVSAQTDVELGGLRVSSLGVNTALAERTTINFARPNPIACDEVVVTSGIGELSLQGLGNSRCRKATVTSVAGGVVLDYSGRDSSDSSASTSLQATIIAGTLTLRVPRSIGVRLTRRNRLLAGDAPKGLLRNGDAFVSSGYEHAAQRLDADVTAMLGSVAVEWINE